MALSFLLSYYLLKALLVFDYQKLKLPAEKTQRSALKQQEVPPDGT